MSKPSPSMVVALIALFVALSGAGHGRDRWQRHPWPLEHREQEHGALRSGCRALRTALQVTNSNASNAASTALGLNVAAGHAPFTVNSGVKVANLNADSLDGLDSSALQQRVSGNCSNTGNAIQAIASNGAVTCQNIQTSVDLNLDAQSPPPFQTTFTTHGGPLLLTFSGSGYRESGSPGFIADRRKHRRRERWGLAALVERDEQRQGDPYAIRLPNRLVSGDAHIQVVSATGFLRLQCRRVGRHDHRTPALTRRLSGRLRS